MVSSRSRNVFLDLGTEVDVISEKDSTNWLVKKAGSNDILSINKKMIELTKQNWRRAKSPEPNQNANMSNNSTPKRLRLRSSSGV